MHLGAHREERSATHFSRRQSPCHTICPLSRIPKQACANKSFDSNKMPLSLPLTCAEGQILPCRALGSLDHLTK